MQRVLSSLSVALVLLAVAAPAARAQKVGIDDEEDDPKGGQRAPLRSAAKNIDTSLPSRPRPAPAAAPAAPAPAPAPAPRAQSPSPSPARAPAAPPPVVARTVEPTPTARPSQPVYVPITPDPARATLPVEPRYRGAPPPLVPAFDDLLDDEKPRPVRVTLTDGTVVTGRVYSEEPRMLIVTTSLGRLSVLRSRIASVAYDAAAGPSGERAVVYPDHPRKAAPPKDR
jgi:hypothetical protein